MKSCEDLWFSLQSCRSSTAPGQQGEEGGWREERGGHEEEGRWHFRAQGPFAGVGIAVDLRGVNQTWEGPKPMFADKLLKIHFALDSFDVYKIDTLLHRSKLRKEQLFVV